MNQYLLYVLIFMALFALELFYFCIADHFNIIDKPNERSSHSMIVLRGGGIIFVLGIWVWSAFFGFQYPWFLAAITLIGGVSFVDDIHSQPDSVRLVAQFTAMGLMFYEIGLLQWGMWWVVIIGLIVCVGITNIVNFMDGINGITAGYSLSVIIPLLVLNGSKSFNCFVVQNGSSEKFGTTIHNLGLGTFVPQSLLIVVALSLIVFAFFNFRPRGKAKCFAGDVGSISIAFIMLFVIGKPIIQTGDVTWMILLLVYGVDGCLTICHRIMLHEHLGEAHRKHAYQLMANELGMSHSLVSSIYMLLQLVISLGFIYLCPDTIDAHWMYLAGAAVMLAIAYVLFMKKYYYLHEEYLAGLEKKK